MKECMKYCKECKDELSCDDCGDKVNYVLMTSFGIQSQINVLNNVQKDILKLMMLNAKNVMIIAYNAKDLENVNNVRLISICMRKMECVTMNLKILKDFIQIKMKEYSKNVWNIVKVVIIRTHVIIAEIM